MLKYCSTVSLSLRHGRVLNVFHVGLGKPFQLEWSLEGDFPSYLIGEIMTSIAGQPCKHEAEGILEQARIKVIRSYRPATVPNELSSRCNGSELSRARWYRLRITPG